MMKYWINQLKSKILVSAILLTLPIQNFAFAQANKNQESVSIKPNTNQIEEAKLVEAPKNAEQQKGKLWSFLHPYQANYSGFYGKDKVGRANRELSFKDEKWQLETYAKLSKLFFKIKSKEFSKFAIDENKLVTHQFYSSTKRTFKDEKKMEQHFDWENKLETGYQGKNKWETPLNDLVYDRVSHLIQLRANFLSNNPSLSFEVSYKGEIKNYQYELEKSETIKTKMGDLKSEKLVRTKSNGDQFVVWLSPELNYLPIKIAQYEKDKSDVVMLLDNINYVSETH